MNYIDFSKYKRFFTFGCSFTQHTYPTWANVMASEMPDAEFYNFGASGAGNTLINIGLAEANLRFNFCETDLVMAMYSTFYREDRWLEGSWMTVGNIYSNRFYDKNYIMKYTDPTGFLIRDLALIYSTHNFIKSLPCDSFFMMSSDYNYELSSESDENDEIKKAVLKLYQPFLDTLPEPLFGSFLDIRNLPCVKYINWEENLHFDHHPTADTYLKYLKHIGIPLTEKSESYVDEVMNKMKFCKHHNDFGKYFVEENKTPRRDMLF